MNIYLAGAENDEHAVVLRALRYPHRLASYFYLRNRSANGIDLFLRNSNGDGDWILDSGLFSMMFGSEQQGSFDYAMLSDYAKRYVADVKAWGWKHAIVECDAQKILGVKETERLRDEVFRPSGLEVIYVWHVPDGEEALARLARTEKRIALSIPELRIVTGGTFRNPGGLPVKKMLIRLLSIIRANGNPRVHLLGSTEQSLVDLPAESSDSTSWLGPGRWGTGILYEPEFNRCRPISKFSPRWAAWRAYCMKRYASALDTVRASVGEERWASYGEEYGNLLGCVVSYLHWMERTNRLSVKVSA